MIKITAGQAQRLTTPAPFGLVSTKKEDGSTNLMAVSWWTCLSNHPPMLGVCLSKKGLSGSLIEKNGEFALNIVGDQLKEAALNCGRISGRMANKPEQFGIALEDAELLDTKIVSHSRVVFECKLVSCCDASDHVLYMAEIVAAHGDAELKQLFAFDGYGRLDTV